MWTLHVGFGGKVTFKFLSANPFNMRTSVISPFTFLTHVHKARLSPLEQATALEKLKLHVVQRTRFTLFSKVESLVSVKMVRGLSSEH